MTAVSPTAINALEDLALRLPSMGGAVAGPLLRDIAAKAPPRTTIVEVGCWLGGCTARLALGVLDRGPGNALPIHCFDRWQATYSQVEKAKRKSELALDEGQNTLHITQENLRPFNVSIHFHQGEIGEASWGGEPISVYVDDASKTPEVFRHAVTTFGPSWMPGETVIVLMDFNYWKAHPERADLRCQSNFVRAHSEHFSQIDGYFSPESSKRAFLYKKQLVWGEVDDYFRSVA